MIGKGEMNGNRFVRVFSRMFDGASVVTHPFSDIITSFSYILHITLSTFDKVDYIVGGASNFLPDIIAFTLSCVFE